MHDPGGHDPGGTTAATPAPVSPPTPAPAPPPTSALWVGRPPGVPGTVPPPAVPLAFLWAAAAGLVACGITLAWASGASSVDPTADPVVAAAHFGMLATLSMGVLGALFQFTPVVTRRPLRSLRLAWITFATWLPASWLLPLGFATRHEVLVEAGGALAALAVAAAVATLSAPLAGAGGDVVAAGIRAAVAGFVVTACFGVVYVADRRAAWFDLPGHVVMAHASVGLLAWLGLTYVSVAEKLWPMFFLAHVPGRRRAGRIAVTAVPTGVVLLSPGLLTNTAWLAWTGAAVVAVGLAAHLTSLVVTLRHRRRSIDLHAAFVVTAALSLVAGVGLALAGAVVLRSDHHAGVALVAASVAAVGGWLLEALVGHVHKVVPFVEWSSLRARGVSYGPTGRQIMFADLYRHSWAAATYVLVTVGIATVTAGLATSEAAIVAAGGWVLAATGIVTAANFWTTARRLGRSAPPVGTDRPAAAPVTGQPA